LGSGHRRRFAQGHERCLSGGSGSSRCYRCWRRSEGSSASGTTCKATQEDGLAHG
jgi:hypothetical protein